jgi:hypothetical protein
MLGSGLLSEGRWLHTSYPQAQEKGRDNMEGAKHMSLDLSSYLGSLLLYWYKVEQ